MAWQFLATLALVTAEPTPVGGPDSESLLIWLGGVPMK